MTASSLMIAVLMHARNAALLAHREVNLLLYLNGGAFGRLSF
jgi:hypothetical protein